MMNFLSLAKEHCSQMKTKDPPQLISISMRVYFDENYKAHPLVIREKGVCQMLSYLWVFVTLSRVFIYKNLNDSVFNC